MLLVLFLSLTANAGGGVPGFLHQCLLTNPIQLSELLVFSGLCPSSGILKTRKHNVSETGCFRPQVRDETLCWEL
jgi:hypothetical protein